MPGTALAVALMSMTQAQPPAQAPLGPTYRFGDYDRDGLADVYVVRGGAADLLYRNLGDGTFVDVTGATGLSGVTGTRLALWQDFDGDGALDLYVSAISGRSRLLRNSGTGTFVDVTLAAGVAHRDGEELFAEWLDLDLDRRADLHVVTSQGDRVYRNLGAGRFELVQLPTASELNAPVVALALPPSNPGVNALSTLGGVTVGGSTPVGNLPMAGAPTFICAGTIVDQASGQCIEASSAPLLGQLYPLTTNFNVSAAGNVGIGTTTPVQKLDIAGAARATQFVSTVTSGQPLLVSSNSKVNNLNADLLDGLNSTVFSQLGQTIEGTEITDGTISNADLAQQAVDTVNIVPGAVDSMAIGAGAVGSTHIANGAVGSSQIADSSISTIDIDQLAIVDYHLAPGAVTGGAIAAGAVGNFHLATNAVASGNIADGSVSLADLATNAVDSSRIVDGTIDVVDLAGNSVTSGKIANATIQDLDLAANCVTSPKIAAGAVGASHLAALSVGSSALQLGAVGLPNLNTSGALTGQVLGFNGSNAAWLSSPAATWTPITSVPYVISTPGAYYLTGNLTMPVAGTAIDVTTTGGVLIDLNGFTLDGANVGQYGIEGGTFVRNGTVANFTLTGIKLGIAGLVERVAATGNGTGISADTATITHCDVFGGIHGIRVTYRSIVSDCRVSNCSSQGFSAGFGSLVVHSVAQTCGDGFTVTDESSVQECVARNCTSIGFVVTSGSARNCVARGNSGTGFTATSALVVGCNTDCPTGYSATGGFNHTRLEGNHAEGNAAVGFSVGLGAKCMLVGNSVIGAGTAYSIAGGNFVGPIVTGATLATNTNPAANYSF